MPDQKGKTGEEKKADFAKRSEVVHGFTDDAEAVIKAKKKHRRRGKRNREGFGSEVLVGNVKNSIQKTHEGVKSGELKVEMKKEEKTEVKKQEVKKELKVKEELEVKKEPEIKKVEEVKKEPEVKPINPFGEENELPPENPFLVEKEKKEEQAQKEVIEEKKSFNPFEQDVFTTKEKVPETNVPAKTMEKDTDQNMKSEVLEAEVVSSENVPEVPAATSGELKDEVKEDFKENFWGVLEQAGITKNKLIGIGIFLVVLIVGILVFVFGLFGGGGNNAPVPEEEVTEEEDGDGGVVPEEEGGSDAYGVISSYILGLEFNPDYTPINAVPIGSVGMDSGVRSAFLLGDVSIREHEDFVRYILILQKLKNIYETDVYALLDISVDRRAALEQFIKQMEDLITEASEISLIVGQRMDELNALYGGYVTEKDSYENAYFTAFSALAGQSSYDYLNLFIGVSQKTTEIKARYNAYVEISDKYSRYISAVQLRYQDIVANSEALIKGVKVFDLPNSDIDAIIPLPEQ